MEFKSQVHTTLEQSKRLVALGLKKETADCCHYYVAGVTDEEIPKNANYPAWSLHRLVEMIPLDIWHAEYENGPRLKHTFWFCKHAPSYNSVENVDFREHPNLYDNIIDCIEWLIDEGYFDKEYLEEQKCEK